MSFRKNLLGAMLLPSLLLVGCGGDGEDFNLFNGEGDFSGGDSSSGDGGDDADGDSTNTSTVSYLPLKVYEKYKSYSGFPSDGLFQGESQFPLIPVHIINPISSTSLQSVSTAVASDYKVTVDDIEIDSSENFPVLQKIVGNSAVLKTALVFDLTGSTDEVDYPKLVAEAKSYISKVQSHSNSIIANQEFVIWSFGESNPALENVTEITSGFTSNAGDLDLALDALKFKKEQIQNAPSSLHKAVVKVVGRYQDDSVTPVIDYANDGDNDLYDRVTSDGIQLSQMVIFSSGPDNLREFEEAKMVEAIESQGFLEFDSNDPASIDNFTNKPVFYFVLGASSPGNPYTELSDIAESTVSLVLNGAAYSFSDSLINRQIGAINRRIDLDNQYIYRYAFLPRQGEHTAIFSSRTDDFNYSLTTQYESAYFTDNGFDVLGAPAYELGSLVEITGPNGEYLSGDEASLQNVSTFKPATRWTSEKFLASDYTWTLTDGVGAPNADGSYSVTSITGVSALLEVENTLRNDTAQITITN